MQTAIEQADALGWHAVADEVEVDARGDMVGTGVVDHDALGGIVAHAPAAQAVLHRLLRPLG
jgi:hypothetical protein